MSSATEVIACIRSGDVEQLNRLLAADPAAANRVDDRGFTPLTMAAYLGNLPAVRALVEAGADLNAQDRAGNTALMGVCFKGNVDIARYLVEAGADTTVTGATGADARAFAEQYGHGEIVALLDKR